MGVGDCASDVGHAHSVGVAMIFIRLTPEGSRTVRETYRNLLKESLRRKKEIADTRIAFAEFRKAGWDETASKELARIHVRIQEGGVK